MTPVVRHHDFSVAPTTAPKAIQTIQTIQTIQKNDPNVSVSPISTILSGAAQDAPPRAVETPPPFDFRAVVAGGVPVVAEPIARVVAAT